MALAEVSRWPGPDGRPLVTVVVPARNEARDIERCLVAILEQDYPHDRLEVVVVDGESTDGTAEKAKAFLAAAPFARTEVVGNAESSTPSNLNAGLAAARGEIVCRVDARSIVPAGYVSRCVEVLRSMEDVSVVGGSQVAVAPRDDARGRGIARALNNRWAMGLSRYRRGAASGPADTVYLGAFRTEDLRRVGGWDPRLGTNQDFDLNRRLAERGTVWFESSLEVGYVPRATLKALFMQYRRFGRAKVRYWRLTRSRPQVRQVALIAVPVIVGATVAVAWVRWPGWRGPAVAALLAGAAALEVGGAQKPASRSIVTHGEAVAAIAVVAGGWLSGVWNELFSRRHPG